MAPGGEHPESHRQPLHGEGSLVAIEGTNVLRKESLREKVARWFLGGIMWMSLLYYLFLLLLFPTALSTSATKKDVPFAANSYLGPGGVLDIIWGAPFFLIIFCAVVYLHLFPRTSRRPMKKKAPKASPGSHPVIVGGPFGVVSAAELLWFVIFAIMVTWMLSVSLIRTFTSISSSSKSSNSGWEHQVKRVALYIGVVGLFCINFLFIPVARGSTLLRLIDVPFEHATKYHVWLGHFVMTLFTLHGLGYILTWIPEGKLNHVFNWKPYTVAILPGVVSLSAGIIMWVTSFIREKEFELFFYCHQLYIVFILGFAFHVGDISFTGAFPGVFIFLFDRFLRFCQSRKEVDVLAAKILPCGTLELVLPKPTSVHYNALSFMFLNIPSVSRLQWHPFSVSSSPEDGQHHLRFLVKPLGSWTRQLSEKINKMATTQCPFRLKAAVEGPYGHETSYFLNYEALLLVAGGIGISPFIAVVRDLLHRYSREEPHLPKDVTLIWAVKTSKELAILNSLSPLAIFPGYESTCNLVVKAFVTRQAEEDVEKGNDGLPAHDGRKAPTVKFDSTGPAPKTISHLAGSGEPLWVGAAFFASLLGYFLATILFGKYYLVPVDHGTLKIVPWKTRVAIVWTCIVLGLVVFGGGVILLWHLFGTKATERQAAVQVPLLGDSEENGHGSNIPVKNLIHRSNTTYGSRPDMREIFESCAKQLKGTNVGVLVCGPDGMQSEVASQCRAFNLASSQDRVAFSYHSVSFQL